MSSCDHRLLKTVAPRPRRWAESATRRPCRRILKAVAETDDRILEHSLIYALIEIGDPKETAAGLSIATPRTAKAAMVAVDQMDGGGLDPKYVAGLLASSGPGLKETAAWIAGRHPEWAGVLAGVLGERLARSDLRPPIALSLNANWVGLPRRPRSRSCWPCNCETPLPR